LCYIIITTNKLIAAHAQNILYHGTLVPTSYWKHPLGCVRRPGLLLLIVLHAVGYYFLRLLSFAIFSKFKHLQWYCIYSGISTCAYLNVSAIKKAVHY